MDLSAASGDDMINIQREIQGHKKIDHPNIIKFINSKQEGKRVWILLEFAEKGDLFNHLTKSNGFDDKTACKYFTQTALAVQHIHSYKIIHRDIKPENLLLSGEDNIKLCDFGWSAEFDEDMRRDTICGTYEYMAPEILFQKQQSTGIDIWALGILLYELLHNKAPYSGRSMAEVKKRIIHSKIKFKPNCNPDAQDLIQKILRVKVEDRPTIEQILKHPFVTKNFYGRIPTSEENCAKSAIKVEDLSSKKEQKPLDYSFSQNNVSRQLTFKDEGRLN